MLRIKTSSPVFRFKLNAASFPATQITMVCHISAGRYPGGGGLARPTSTSDGGRHQMGWHSHLNRAGWQSPAGVAQPIPSTLIAYIRVHLPRDGPPDNVFLFGVRASCVFWIRIHFGCVSNAIFWIRLDTKFMFSYPKRYILDTFYGYAHTGFWIRNFCFGYVFFVLDTARHMLLSHTSCVEQ